MARKTCDLCSGDIDNSHGQDGNTQVMRLILDYPEVVKKTAAGTPDTIESKRDKLEICQFCASTIKHLVYVLEHNEDPLKVDGDSRES